MKLGWPLPLFLDAHGERALEALSRVDHRLGNLAPDDPVLGCVPHLELAARDPVGIILSGGPASIYEPGAPSVDPGIFDLGVPVLGICYGMQAMAAALGGEVSNTGIGEFGKTPVILGEGSLLFGELPPEQTAWMSHRDSIVRAPAGFSVTASSDTTPVAGMSCRGMETI